MGLPSAFNTIRPNSAEGVTDEGGGDAFPALQFELVDNSVEADIEIIPGLGIPVGQFLEPILTSRIGSFAQNLITNIVSAISRPGVARCTFAASDGGLDQLIQACPDGTSEREELARISQGALRIALRTCR